jgi:hypothetical protein
MRRAAALTILLAIVVASPAVAVVYKRIGSKSGSGDFAIALASGTATKPKAVYVAVFATPTQPVSVNWSLVCSKGASAGSKSGDFTTSSSAKRKLRLSTSNPDSCTVSASGQLARGGKIVVRLYKR